jgi:hypothetical protein
LNTLLLVLRCLAAGPHVDWRGLWTHEFTGTLVPSDPSSTNIDVRTFVSPWVLPWHWKPNGAPSFGSVPRTSPLWGPGWLQMVWLVTSFLSR